MLISTRSNDTRIVPSAKGQLPHMWEARASQADSDSTRSLDRLSARTLERNSLRRVRGQGRPSRRNQARVQKLKTQRERADRLLRRRHLIVTKPSNIKPQDQATLDELLSLSPMLGILRSFVNDLHELFAIRRRKNQAWKIWRRMRRHRSYLENEYLSKALKVLSKDNMLGLLCYLDRPPCNRSKLRTNNHVERCNRVLRYLEKVRYKWRRRRTIVRHILLQFGNWIKRKENNLETAT